MNNSRQPKRSPKVSVVLTTYNRADLVGKAIDSILNQKFKDFELIVVDDGSTDNTQKVLSDYARGDARIRAIRQKNGGLARARNAGAKVAQGEYIAWMDDDDLSLPGRLLAQVSYLEQHPEDSACICAMEYKLPDGSIRRSKTQKSLRKAKRKLRIKDGISRPPVHLDGTTLIKRSAFKHLRGYDKFFIVTEDSDFTVRFWEEFSAGIVPEVSYVYMLGKKRNSLNYKYAFFNSIYCIASHVRLCRQRAEKQAEQAANDATWFPLTWQQVFRGISQLPLNTRRQLFLRYMLRKRTLQTREYFSLAVYIFFLSFIRQFNLRGSFLLFYLLKMRYLIYFLCKGDGSAFKAIIHTNYFGARQGDRSTGSIDSASADFDLSKNIKDARK